MFWVFVGVYGGLVVAYRAGGVLPLILGLCFLFTGIFLFFKSLSVKSEKVRNYCGIISGILIWAFVGEVAEHTGLFDIASIKMGPLLFLFLIFYLPLLGFLPSGANFTLSSFGAIWFLHYFMISQFDTMGRKSWVTYPSAILFLVLTIILVRRGKFSDSISKKMAYYYFAFLTGWCVLEYLWGWRVLPGPWMLKGG